MSDLFVRPDGNPMEFYLADLERGENIHYTVLIEDNGGKVKRTKNDKVLIFTTPTKCLNYPFVFDVKFIDDCIQERKILNVNLYFLGDRRLEDPYNHVCRMSKLIMRTSDCLCNQIGNENIFTKVRAQTSTEYARLKRVVDQDDNQQKSLNNASYPKNDIHKQLNVERKNREENCVETKNTDKNKYKQTTLKKIKINSPNTPNKQNKQTIIRETDSEPELLEVPRTPLNNKKTNINKKKKMEEINLKRTRNQETVNLIKPSTSKDTSFDFEVIDLTSVREYEDIHAKESAESNKVRRLIAENVKSKNLDQHGNPHSFSKNFEPWEAEMMIKFLIEFDQIGNAKDFTTWKYAFKLKFLPKRRSATDMHKYFNRIILPNIENYSLKRTVFNKFKALGLPKKILDDD